jgi:hypothetical protein
MTAEVADGIDMLAVTNLDAAGKALQWEDGRSAEPLALPYSLEG